MSMRDSSTAGSLSKAMSTEMFRAARCRQEQRVEIEMDRRDRSNGCYSATRLRHWRHKSTTQAASDERPANMRCTRRPRAS